MKNLKDIFEGLLSGQDKIMSNSEDISNIIMDVTEMHELAKLVNNANAVKTPYGFNDVRGNLLEHGDVVLLCPNRSQYQGKLNVNVFSFGIVNRYLKSKSIEVICSVKSSFDILNIDIKTPYNDFYKVSVYPSELYLVAKAKDAKKFLKSL